MKTHWIVLFRLSSLGQVNKAPACMQISTHRNEKWQWDAMDHYWMCLERFAYWLTWIDITSRSLLISQIQYIWPTGTRCWAPSNRYYNYNYHTTTMSKAIPRDYGTDSYRVNSNVTIVGGEYRAKAASCSSPLLTQVTEPSSLLPASSPDLSLNGKFK